MDGGGAELGLGRLLEEEEGSLLPASPGAQALSPVRPVGSGAAPLGSGQSSSSSEPENLVPASLASLALAASSRCFAADCALPLLPPRCPLFFSVVAVLTALPVQVKLAIYHRDFVLTKGRIRDCVRDCRCKTLPDLPLGCAALLSRYPACTCQIPCPCTV